MKFAFCLTLALVAIAAAKDFPQPAETFHAIATITGPDFTVDAELAHKPHHDNSFSSLPQYDVVTKSWVDYESSLMWSYTDQAGVEECYCFESGPEPGPEPFDELELLQEGIACGDGLTCDVWGITIEEVGMKQQIAVDTAVEWMKLVWAEIDVKNPEGESHMHIDYVMDNTSGPEENWTVDSSCPDRK